MSHWYSKTGESKYEVPKPDGSGMRPTTLRDARKPENLWLPSVTTILAEMQGKQQLVGWMKEQVAMAAVSMPKDEWNSLDPDTLAKKILLDADEYSERARVRGGLLHDAMEQYAKDGALPGNPETLDLMGPALDWWDANVEKVYYTEETFVGDGYAGRVDLVALLKNGKIYIVDFKTRKRGKPSTKAEKAIGCGKFGKYIEDVYQLAAYRGAVNAEGIGVGGCANLLIDSSKPTPVEFREYSWKELDRMYCAWSFKVADWSLSKDYRPDVPEKSVGLVSELLGKVYDRFDLVG